MTGNGARGTTHLQRWCKGKPPLIVLTAKMIALSAHAMQECVQTVRDREMPTFFRTSMDARRWSRCYFRTPRLQRYFFEFILYGDSHLHSKVSSLWRDLQWAARQPGQWWAAFFEQISESEFRLEYHRAVYLIKCLDRHLDRTLAEAQDPNTSACPRMNELLHSPEIRFIYQVYAPCLTLYQATPNILFARAVDGDLDALGNLLRLDPGVASMYPFKQRLQLMRFDPAKQHDYDRLMAATHALPVRVPGLAACKAFGAAILRQLAKGCCILERKGSSWTVSKFRLTSGDIRRLYDAVARDRTGFRDRSLPPTPWALQASLKRATKDFLSIVHNGTKHSPQMSH